MTHVGFERPENEDTIEVSSRSGEDKLEHWVGSLASSGGWALLADGMGGHVAGEVASYLAVELLKPAMAKINGVNDASLALKAVHAGLFDSMREHPFLEGMGTTIAGALLLGGSALVFNIGDSRIYLQSNGRLSKISEDHVVEGNVLTQCLGGSFSPIRPHVRTVAVQQGSTLVVIREARCDRFHSRAPGKPSACLRAGPRLLEHPPGG